MKKIKENDLIRLNNNDVMTLGEALDCGAVILRSFTTYNAVKETTITKYYAADGDMLFDISKDLYIKRGGKWNISNVK